MTVDVAAAFIFFGACAKKMFFLKTAHSMLFSIYKNDPWNAAESNRRT